MISRTFLTRILTAAIFTLLSIPASAQTITASANIDSSTYLIGEAIALHLEVKHDPSIFFTWSIADSLGDGFLKIKNGTSDTFHIPHGIIERKTILIAGFDSGMRQIPSLTFFYKDETGQVASISTAAVPVTILPVKVDTSRGMKPIKSVLPVSAPGEDHTVLYFSVAVSILLLAALIFFFLRFRRKKKYFPVKTTPKTEKYTYEVAMKKLSEIELQHLWQNDRIGEYYVSLSDILRKYIQDTFQVPALENTSSEIIHLLDEKIQNKNITEHLEKNLLVADLVKFARAKPFTDQHHEFMSFAKKFMEQTRSFSSPSQNGVR